MGKYKAYPEYKSSKVNYLGDIPKEWKLIKFGITNLSAELGGNYLASEGEQGIAVIKMGNLERGVVNLAKIERIPLNEKYDTHHLLKAGDFLFNTRNSLELVGKVSVWREELEHAIYNSNILRITFDKKFVDSTDFISYLFNSDRALSQLRLIAKGTTSVAAIYYKDLSSLVFAFPPVREQAKIAKFLDHETAQIDTLIEKQQTLIQLLKEKRQAVISHAVTKGLNSDAPMKDSGVEWLGEVPEHWSVKSYRHASKIYRGKFGHRPRNDPAFYDGDYPFIQTGDVARAGKIITSYSQTLNEKGKSVSQLFPAGTLMMAIAANIGDTAILGFEAYAPDSVVGFKPYKGIDVEFLRYSFLAALPAFEQTSTQSTQANLNVDRIGTVKGAFPSHYEQEKIVIYLDNMLERYRAIEVKANEQIQLMQERRTALISAAVTGKIDVRGWRASE